MSLFYLVLQDARVRAIISRIWHQCFSSGAAGLEQTIAASYGGILESYWVRGTCVRTFWAHLDGCFSAAQQMLVSSTLELDLAFPYPTTKLTSLILLQSSDRSQLSLQH